MSLPAALLAYRLSGDRIVPAFLGPEDQPWLRALIDARAACAGRRRREWRDELAQVAAPVRKRAIAAHVLDGLGRDVQPAGVDPRAARAAVFATAAAAAAPRAEILTSVAASLGISATALDARLFADLPDERLLTGVDLAPTELAARANLALAAGLLGRAARVRIELDGNALPVVRRAKLRGLIVHVTPSEIEISGPLALFHHTRVYGRALGSLLPLLAWCDRFHLRADCVLPEGRAVLELDRRDPIFPAEEPQRYDSGLEARLERDLRRHAPAWEVIRDPHPVVAGDALVFPDFALVHREDPAQRWWLELVGFWTPEYLARKLAAYRAARLSDLILCIDERRRCADGDLPPGARVVWYRGSVKPADVLAAMAAPAAPSRVEDGVVAAVRELAATSPYGNAFLPAIERRLGRRVPLDELIALGRAGLVALNRPTEHYAIRPLEPPRLPLPVTPASVCAHVAPALDELRAAGLPPLYHLVRERFDWLAPDGRDLLAAIVRDLARDGTIVLGQRRGKVTIGCPG